MSTSLLYHVCGVRGYTLTKTEFNGGMILFYVHASATTRKLAVESLNPHASETRVGTTWRGRTRRRAIQAPIDE